MRYILFYFEVSTENLYDRRPVIHGWFKITLRVGMNLKNREIVRG